VSGDRAVDPAVVAAVAALVEVMAYDCTLSFLYDHESRGAERQAWRDLTKEAAEAVGHRVREAASALAGPASSGTVSGRLSAAWAAGSDRARAASAALNPGGVS
jgi:hypothetical protein